MDLQNSLSLYMMRSLIPQCRGAPHKFSQKGLFVLASKSPTHSLGVRDIM